MKYDVVALGELLIDFTYSAKSSQGNMLFESNPGGAPGNVCSVLSKLGRKTVFIGKVGDDMFGELMIETLSNCGIDTVGIIKDASANTTLAFVKNDQDGEREFSFFRNNSADTMLEKDEINKSLLDSCKIFHFGSLSLTHAPVRQATEFAVISAKESGAYISFDPNLRPKLWRDLDEGRNRIKWGLGVCDILKVSDEELLFITKSDSVDNGIRLLKDEFPKIKLIFLTQGAEGARGYWGDICGFKNAYKLSNTIDTTGAGDAFFGCCLNFCLDMDLDLPSEEKLLEILDFSNAAAALVTTKKGALLSMPDADEVRTLMKLKDIH